MSEFSRNLAVIIGIDAYNSGIPLLHNAVNDAKQLGEILHQKHGYEVQICVDQAATLNDLKTLFEQELPQTVTADDRLLFYFAGHGIALNGEDGPVGYLIPQDARLGNIQTYLPMTQVQAALEQLPCRHFLGILDCCFAGAFRWGSTRDLLVAPEVIHRERYDRFIQDPAWQIITSAASDQKALDAFALHSDRGAVGEHSPFAAALIEAWSGDADRPALRADAQRQDDRYTPPAPRKPVGDGVVTATELYLYLRDRVELATEAQRQRQTPGIWSLKKHDKGEYIFLTPDHPLNLPPAPPLDESKNPYRGLESFGTEHKDLFFGRTAVIEQLAAFVANRPLTVVLGASGSGKSSLVKAGLIPKLQESQRQETPETDWFSVVIRPGKSPFAALNVALNQETTAQDNYVDLIANWKRAHPTTKILLVVDQCEELITLCSDQQESRTFLNELEKVMTAHPDTIQIVLTLRSDFEPQLRDLALKERWQAARFILPAMSRSELREAIEKPAEARVMYFEPHQLVEQLIDEVEDMPGALPLLSFALSELYLKYLKRQREASFRGETLDRAITQADYDELGGVTRSLTQRADQEYNALGAAYEQTIQTVMLRMVAVGSGELARRRVSWAELTYPPAKAEQVKAVIAQFSAARLLVEGRDAQGERYVEPAHDALIQGWAKLRDWTKAEKNLDLQRRLTPAAFEWKTKQQNRFLWNADPYLEVLHKEVFNSPEHNWLNQVETEFVQRSVQQKQRNVRTRWGIAIAVMLGLSGLAIAAWVGQQQARIGQMEAASQASESRLQGRQPSLDALLASLQAGSLLQQLQQNPVSLLNNDQIDPIVRNLRKAIYTVRETNRLEGFSGRVVKVFWKDDRLLIVTIEQEGTVHIWNRQNQKEFKLDRPPGSTTDVELSPDGNLLAIAGGEGGTVSLWDWQQQQVTAELPVDGNIKRLRFSPDSRRLAVVGYRLTDTGVFNIFYQWDLATNAYSQATRPNLLDVGFDTQGQLLQAIAQEDGTIQILNASNQLLQQFNSGVSHAPVNAVFNLDGSRIFINQKRNDDQGLEEGAIVRDLNSGEVTALGQDSTFAFSAQGSILATTGAADGMVRLRTGAGEPIEFKAHQTEVANLDFKEDGSQLATASADGTVRIWSVKPQPLTFLQQLPDSFQSVAFQPGSNQMIGQSPNGVLHWFNAKGEQTNQSQAALPLFDEMSFSPDGQQVVALAQDGTLYSLKPDGTELKRFAGNYASSNNVFPPSNVAFSPDGTQVAVISGDENRKQINILDVASGQVVKNIPQRQPTSFDQVIWQPSDRILSASLLIATDGNPDNSVRLWDVASETQYATPLTARLRNSFTSLTFNQDGSMMAIAENDRIILTYLDGTAMAEFQADSGRIKSLKLSSDGAFLLSAGENGTTKLWQIGELDQLMKQGCDRVHNYLAHNPEVSESDRNLCNK